MAVQPRNLEALTTLSVLAPTTVDAANNTTGVDLSSIDGDALLVLSATASAADTGIKVKVQSSATQNGTYADVSGAAFTDLGASAAVRTVTVPREELGAWYRLAFTNETGTFSAVVSCVAIGSKRYT